MRLGSSSNVEYTLGGLLKDFEKSQPLGHQFIVHTGDVPDSW
jgi:hypothetical protein